MRFARLQIVLAAALLSVVSGRVLAQVEHEKSLFSEEDEKTLAAYPLDLVKFDRFETALRELDLQAQKDEALKAELDQDEAKAAGLDRFIESIEKEKPKMMAILKAAGMTAREFVLTSFSVTIAMVYADLIKAQADAALPPYVPRENLGFVKRYEERLSKLFQDLNHE
ncbi:hypothetical protein AYO41_01915 [Verrucomicrobia bacterium SCGC AG-212-E04]|nr:hypothetical protein AYO41_01915 [Verrucomicrobia bacterium SCGC AG-212-E04]